MGVVCQVQVPEDHALPLLVDFEWAKFRKSIVLPFPETFSTFPQGRAHHLLEAHGRVNVLDDLKRVHAERTQDLAPYYFPESLKVWPLQEIFLRYVTQALHAVVPGLPLVNHSCDALPQLLGGLATKPVCEGHIVTLVYDLWNLVQCVSLPSLRLLLGPPLLAGRLILLLLFSMAIAL